MPLIRVLDVSGPSVVGVFALAIDHGVLRLAITLHGCVAQRLGTGIRQASNRTTVLPKIPSNWVMTGALAGLESVSRIPHIPANTCQDSRELQIVARAE